MALGAEPDTSLAAELERSGVAVHCIGDARELGYIEGAIRTGHAAGRQI